ncbi:TetR/AcrR family transcriptional regulator [Paraconexibacter sp.]|uniref:TetR/AcrR family transcriptional regulator n=1 Tax=Paraconexibacter sp. TaxID=2949640 RepID=UPI003568B7B8
MAADTDKREGRVQRRRTRTRAALLDAAEQAFTRDGYHGVTMESLAAEADVSVGSIYQHFTNKDGLYLKVAERATDLFAGYLEQAYAASESPLEQVMACGHAYLLFHLEHPGAFRLIAFDGVESRAPAGGEAAHREATARTAAVIARFRDCIAAAVASGEAGPHVDPELTARVLFGAWNGIVGLGLRHDELRQDDDAITACVEQMRQIVLNGLVDPGYRDVGGSARAALLTIESPQNDDD